jgi:hypothetical protein
MSSYALFTLKAKFCTDRFRLETSDQSLSLELEVPKMALQAFVLEARRPRDSLNVKRTRACDVWVECFVKLECITVVGRHGRHFHVEQLIQV